MARTELPHGIILPAEYSDDWYDDMTSNLSKLDEVIGSDAEKLSEEDVGAAALSNDYTDLDNKPSIPTKTSDLTNDSNFVDNTDPAVASGITSAKVTSYDSHIADTDIHVTAADKNKWNNGVTQAYVLRYSSTAITDNSTIAYSTLDNTDNIKVSDKIIDTDGKIFSIVSVDSDNSTVTVGSALIDLALDANVMHLSGNETCTGNKGFVDNIIAKKIISNVAQLQINARSDADSVAVIAGASAAEGGSVWIYGKNSSNNSNVTLQVYDTNANTYHAARLLMDGSLRPTVSNNGLGSAGFKWVSFNGVEPSLLSFPDLNSALDISGYFTLDTSSNTYTPSANGWICIKGVSSGAAGIYVESSNGFYCSANNLTDINSAARFVHLSFPVIKNEQYTIVLKTVNTSISAKFYPCLGNV